MRRSNTTWAAYHVIGQGEDIYFKTSAVDTLLIAAKRLRTYLTKNDTHQSGSFAAVFKDRLEITKEEYDQLLGQRLENTGTARNIVMNHRHWMRSGCRKQSLLHSVLS